MNKVHAALLVTCLMFFTCENESPDNVGEIKCSVGSRALAALSGNMVFDRGYVHLMKVEVSGHTNSVPEFASHSFDTPEQFFFIGDDPRQPIKVPIAQASYTDPKIDLFFFRDPYILQLRDTTYADADNGGEDGGDNDSSDDDDEGEEGDDDDEDGNDDEDGDDDNEGDEDDEDQDDNDDEGRKNQHLSNAKTVDLSHFVKYSRPSLVLVGRYDHSGLAASVLIALDLDRLHLLPTGPPSQSLVVKKESHIEGIATFQPGRWFETITEKDIQNATLIQFRGQTVLFIHKDFNKRLHDLISREVEKSTALQFKINENL